VAGKTGTTQDNTDGWFILMHPGMVAGAWVGFNDQRVTMRSNRWGQGGQNAILLVGDFFRSALNAQLIDAKAQFPQARRPLPIEAPLPMEASVQVEEESEFRPADPTTVAAARPTGGSSTITSSEPPKGAMELDRVVAAIERTQPSRVVLAQPVAAAAPAASAAASASQPVRAPPLVSVSEVAREALAMPAEEPGAQAPR
jgi:penicillin-binding protein 1A